MHPLYTVKPYKPGDMLKMDSPQYDPLSLGDPVALDILGQGSYSYTLFKEDTVLAIGGLSYQWKLCFYAWLVVDQSLNDPIEGRRLIRVVRSIIRTHISRMSLQRVNCHVSHSQMKNVRFAELVGFKREFPMRGAGPQGEDVESMYFTREGCHG